MLTEASARARAPKREASRCRRRFCRSIRAAAAFARSSAAPITKSRRSIGRRACGGSPGRRSKRLPISRQSRRSAQRRRRWAAAFAAGIAGAAFYAYITPRLGAHLPHFFPHIRDGIIVCGVFGVVYFAATMLFGVPEARPALARFRR